MQQTTWQRIARTGLVFADAGKAAEGYVLLTPHNSANITLLVDAQGREVHRWTHQGMCGGFSYLLPNGNIFYNARLDAPAEAFDRDFSRYRCGSHLELDRDGNIVWDYRDAASHDDSRRRALGGLMHITSGQIPDDAARRIAPGRDGPLFGDMIVSSEPDGTEIWRWKSWEHLDLDDPCNRQVRDSSLWPHVNAIELGGDGTFTISLKNLDCVMVINRGNGTVEERYGSGGGQERFHGPNDVRLMPEGRLLLVDSGRGRPAARAWSRIVEIERGSGRIVREYCDRPADSFFSPDIAGVDACGNGNLLITEGRTGRIFQVTRDGEVVWEFINPHFARSVDGIDNAVYRARFYTHDQVRHLL